MWYMLFRFADLLVDAIDKEVAGMEWEEYYSDTPGEFRTTPEKLKARLVRRRAFHFRVYWFKALADEKPPSFEMKYPLFLSLERAF